MLVIKITTKGKITSMIESRHIEDRAEWLAWRKQNVNASDIGALFNCHPRMTTLKLYAMARGTEFDDGDDDAAKAGRRYEPTIAHCVAEDRPDWSVHLANCYLVDPVRRIGATPDRIIGDPARREFGILELKSVAPHVFERDWLDGAVIPEWIRWQVATQMMLKETSWGAVAVMVRGSFAADVTIIEVERNPASDAAIINAVAEFWKCVDNAREPEPDFERDRAAIKALNPAEHVGKQIDLTARNDLPVMLAERAQKVEQIKRLKAECEAVEAEIMFRMGEAETATLNGWRTIFKTVDVAGYTVKPRSARVLRIYDKRGRI